MCALWNKLVWHVRGVIGPPKNWWERHSPDCGTKYRGCAPDCPKDEYERTGRWPLAR